MNAQVWIAILVGVAAVVDDLSRRQISNWICVAALVGGLGWQAGQYGWMGLAYGLGGAAAGFAAFLVFYLLGGMGGGDVKLMAGFGALLGAGRLLEATMWTAGMGGMLALGVLGFRAIRRTIAGPAPDSGVPLTAEQKLHQESIPYAPAIALGVWLSLVPKI
ncbi:MAG: prepilin peptidase [Acidobacteriota bacterium]